MSRPKLSRFAVPVLAVVSTVALAACADRTPTPPAPLFHEENPPPGGTLTICKVGTSAAFTVYENGVQTTTVTLGPGECRLVADADPVVVIATATETVPAGAVLDSIVVVTTFPDGSQAITTLPAGSTSVTKEVSHYPIVATFFNRATGGPGRMTGGGGQITIGDVQITRGFTIHCDITLSNNLEINWPGNKWHITKPLTSAQCIDDPAISPEPPPAPFDTFLGEGIGELNGVPGSTVRFIFVDSGEPGGSNDKAQIQIWSAGGTLVLDVPLSFLDHGNLQAHYDQPHGNKP